MRITVNKSHVVGKDLKVAVKTALKDLKLKGSTKSSAQKKQVALQFKVIMFKVLKGLQNSPLYVTADTFSGKFVIDNDGEIPTATAEPTTTDENVTTQEALTPTQQDAVTLQATPFAKVIDAKKRLKALNEELKDLKEDYSYALVEGKFQVGRLTSEDMGVFMKLVDKVKDAKLKLDAASYSVMKHLNTCTLIVPRTSHVEQFREIVALHMKSKAPYLALKMLLAMATNSKVSRDELLKMLSPKESEKDTYTNVLNKLNEDTEKLKQGLKLMENWNPLVQTLGSAKI